MSYICIPKHQTQVSVKWFHTGRGDVDVIAMTTMQFVCKDEIGFQRFLLKVLEQSV